MNETAIEATLTGMADLFRHWPDAPLFHWPEEVSLEYENVTFPSEDGVPLEGWFFPCKGSNKVLIANHPRLFNRAGIPSHMEPFASMLRPAGNDFDVNLLPDYKILHDAGYNVLAYDLRNHGQSGRANGIVYTAGRFESRDVIGSVKYIRSRPDTRNMTLGLFPRCMGANAAFFAISRAPKLFEDVRVILAPQPVSANMTHRVQLEASGLTDPQYYDRLNDMIFWRTNHRMEQLTPIPWVRSVQIPTLIYQVRNDITTRPEDVQAIFDSLAAPEKKLIWIDNSTRRWDAYLELQRRPQVYLDWLNTYMN
jgi:pimeloyl-ACP methyl ester carboxylesterase